MDKKTLLVKEWLAKAEHDLGMAQLALEHKGEYTDSICFHCQQYVEKILKGYLTCLDMDFSKSHSLVYLMDMIAAKEKVNEELYSIAELLDDYAVGIRNPGNCYEPTREDATNAYDAALKIKNTIYLHIRKYLISRNLNTRKDNSEGREMDF